jgi:hypothetical protein
MRAKLIVEGYEFDIDISDPKLQELIAPKKKTGYEPVEKNQKWYCVKGNEDILTCTNYGYSDDARYYKNANYYSNKTVAENNARADKLMRQLRRFAVNSRVDKLDWNDNTQTKWAICHGQDGIGVCQSRSSHCCGTIYFDRLIDAQKAIDTFRNELTWYFTEYKDSL